MGPNKRSEVRLKCNTLQEHDAKVPIITKYMSAFMESVFMANANPESSISRPPKCEPQDSRKQGRKSDRLDPDIINPYWLCCLVLNFTRLVRDPDFFIRNAWLWLWSLAFGIVLLSFAWLLTCCFHIVVVEWSVKNDIACARTAFTTRRQRGNFHI